MTGIALILAFVVSIILMIVAISRWKIHPFLAIMGISLILGLLAGIPLVDKTALDGTRIQGIAGVIGSGFSATFTSIGIVIVLGALIGSILEKTGAALKLADMVIGLIGRKHPVAAMEIMGWILSIPVFCDSGFVILDPIRKSLTARTAVSSVAMTSGLSTGLYLSHVFIPPTPGPIAAANALGIADNLLMVMGFGVLCSIFPLIAGLAFANHIGRKVKSDDECEDNSSSAYESLLESYGRLTGGFDAAAPILVPIVLMAASSVVSMAGATSWWADVLRFLGTPIIALAVGFICAVCQLRRAGKVHDLYAITNETLKTVGPILFITAAGGVLGKVISCSDMVPFITSHSDVLKPVGIFFPFLLSAILKTAQGSSTVALTTAAGIVSPILPALGFADPVNATLVCMAIGAGAMTVSHANDSYFWVVTNFGRMSPQKGYRVQTMGTLVLGLSAMSEIFILTLIF